MNIQRALTIILLVFLGFAPLPAQVQRGKATYYSRRATGARTASGERLHHDSLTCAHRTYPFGTLLKVRNLNNGKEVVVRVTDRGPYVRGHIIDLSYAAAKKIDIIHHGVVMVEVTKVGEITVPYRSDQRIELPEMDFEISEAGYSLIDQWAQTPEKGKQKDTKTKEKKNARPSAKSQKAERKPSNNPIRNIFSKIKQWGEDTF